MSTETPDPKPRFDGFTTIDGKFTYTGKLKEGVAFVGRDYGIEVVVVCKSMDDLRYWFRRMFPDICMRETSCRDLKFGAAENFSAAPQPEASK